MGAYCCIDVTASESKLGGSKKPRPNLTQVGLALAKKTGSTFIDVSGGWIHLSNGYMCNYRPLTALDAHGKSDCFHGTTKEYVDTYCISDALLGGYKAYRCPRGIF